MDYLVFEVTKEKAFLHDVGDHPNVYAAVKKLGRLPEAESLLLAIPKLGVHAYMVGDDPHDLGPLSAMDRSAAVEMARERLGGMKA